VRILLVTPYLPHSRIGHGGGSAVRALVRELGQRHDVSLVSLLRPGDGDPQDTARDLGVTIEAVPFLDAAAGGLSRIPLIAGRAGAALRSLVSGYPQYVTKYAHRHLLQQTIAVIEDWAPDVVQVEYLQLSLLMKGLRQWRDGREHGPRLIMDSHELGSLPRRRRAREATGFTRWLLETEATAWDRVARDVSRWADQTLCVTDQDRQLLASAGGQNLVTVPLGIDTDHPLIERPDHPPFRLLFLGSFQHPPNRSAAGILCQRIWPEVRQALPGWKLVLAGPGSDTFLASLDAPKKDVQALGFVDDLTPLFSSCSLFVAPLTEGGGIKIKILEAMARGIPVVTTPIGAEGITQKNEDLVWWADEVEDFAALITEAAGDRDACQRRALAARAHIEQHFSWGAVVDRLEAVYRGTH